MGSGHKTDKNRFLAVLIINAIMFSSELAIGLYSNSWAMLSDSFHVFIDILAPLAALVPELEFAKANREKIRNVSAKINISLFFIIGGAVIWEALVRIKYPPIITVNFWFFVVAIIGLVSNLYCAGILEKGEEEYSLNRYALFWHMLLDAAGSIIVIIAGIAIKLGGPTIIDPVLSIVLAMLIFIGLGIFFSKNRRH